MKKLIIQIILAGIIIFLGYKCYESIKIPQQFKVIKEQRYARIADRLKDIRTARPLVDVPIIRKDFIIDEYQLYQAKIVGADAVLLIAAALKQEKCQELAEQAHELGLEVLLEIHSAEELPYINSKIDMIGINNRNLGTFFTDVENSFRLAGQLPQDAVLVSESGISDPEVVKRLRTAGFRGFLIGETFMKTPQPGETLQNFLKAIQ